jgi:8-oxo-dGTP diphosphatase
VTPSHDSEVPARGQQVITATALIHRRGDVGAEAFLPRRATTKRFLPGFFELPGGHIDFGEDIVVGLEREVMEEFGVRIQVGDPFHAFTYMNEIKGSHSIEVVYFATFDDPVDPIALNPYDHSEARWVTLDDLDDVDPMTPEERAGVRKALQILNGAPLTFE